MINEYISDLKKEFSGYNMQALSADMLAGITVAAVSLSLALAFGVSTGADAAAGLITAIVSAFVMCSLSGASYQISGPTGTMAVVLVPLATHYGLKTVLLTGALAGVILILAGALKAGRLISFIPKAVITGFSSGIALIIALGQVENLFGVKSHGEETYLRVFNMFRDGFSPNLHAVAIGASVMMLMLVWPKKWGARVPASLVAVILAIAAQLIFKFPVNTVGTIPKTLLHDTRLSITDIFTADINVILMPAVSIAALCMIESLLCGAAAGKMKGEMLRRDRELVAQGVGNILLPFFGGVPASAALARTGFAIKSGGRTRLTGVFQGVTLLLSMFLLSPLISQIPMPALAGVLMVTAWRMNDWIGIKYIFGKKFKGAITKFLITLLCTVVFDLTVAIAAGCLIGMIIFIFRVSDLEVEISEFDPERVDVDINLLQHVQVVYITGAVFFGSSDNFAKKIRVTTGSTLILSMRGVPSMDESGAQEIIEFYEEKKKEGVEILFCGIQPKVKEFLDRSGMMGEVGDGRFFNTAKDALLSLNI